MNINAEMVDYIRTMVNRDDDANDRIGQRLDDSGWGDFSILLGAVFVLAVERKCGDSLDAARAIRLVAEMRASAPIPEDYIDANAAETLIRSALDPEIEYDINPEMVGRIQGLVIMHVLGASDVSNDDREAVYSEAAQMVARL